MSMRTKVLRAIVPLFIAVMTGALTAAGAQADEAAMIMPDQMTWVDGPPVLPPGAQIAVLSGDPSKEGAFVFRLKFPADYQIPAHTHSTAELVTVISGTLNLGHGEKLDRSMSQPLPVGGFIELPAGHPHFVRTGEEIVVQVHGNGPFDIKYMDAADDPREQAAK
jgi:quercetin dioxygenase-like cupin family protein